jgi:hypothetical protein
MSKRRDYHVVPHDQGWAVRREGAERVGSTHRTQSDAYDTARDRAIRDRVEVVTHRRDGTIRDSDSFGSDPMPPRDRKY